MSEAEVSEYQLWNKAAEVQSLCLQPPNGVTVRPLVSVSQFSHMSHGNNKKYFSL